MKELVGHSVQQLIPTIIQDNPQVRAVQLIIHPANWNWRQSNIDPESQARDLYKGLQQTARPMVEVPRCDVLCNYPKVIQQIITCFKDYFPHPVVSLCSSVVTDYETLHIPMMNYHPEAVEPKSEEGFRRVEKLLSIIARSTMYLAQTDRYWHSYGTQLMTATAWAHWLGLHSNAVSLVSPRYIGQSLRDGYSPLRQVGIPNSDIKTVEPHIVAEIQPNHNYDAVWNYKPSPIDYGIEVSRALPAGAHLKIVGAKE